MAGLFTFNTVNGPVFCINEGIQGTMREMTTISRTI